MAQKLNTLTDEDLMIAYQKGDSKAFEVLYDRHSARVWAYIRKRTLSGQQTDDTFQAIFLKLHRSRARYDASFPFLPWLFTICRNAIRDDCRASAIRPLVDDPSRVDELAAEPPTESPALSLDALPKQQRSAVELRYSEGLSFDEIAKRLGTSPTNVRQVVSRGVRKLRELAMGSKA